MLKIIADFIRSHMPQGYTAMLQLFYIPSEEYIRSQILVSDLRPDLIMWSTRSHTAYFPELTVCFDTNSSVAAKRKTSKYFEVVEGITIIALYREVAA